MIRSTVRYISFAILAITTVCAGATAQDLYAADYNDGKILKVAPGGATTTFYNSGSRIHFGIAFDATGNLLYSNYASANILKIDKTGVSTVFAAANSASYLAVDKAGNVWESSFSTGNVTKFSASGTVLATYNISGPDLYGIALDRRGNAFVADWLSNNIYEINTSGTVSVAVSGLNKPVGIAFDSYDNMYVSQDGNGSIMKYAAGGGSSVFASGYTYPDAMAFDSSNNLFVADEYRDTIYKILPNGTSSIYPSSGLNGVEGLAFAPTETSTTPEPGTMAFTAAVGVSAFTALRRRRRV